MTTYPRDLAGYGATPPDARWPRGARLALQIVVNYEEGSEYTILDGDGRTEVGLAEAPGGRTPKDVRAGEPRAAFSAELRGRGQGAAAARAARGDGRRALEAELHPRFVLPQAVQFMSFSYGVRLREASNGPIGVLGVEYLVALDAI